MQPTYHIPENSKPSKKCEPKNGEQDIDETTEQMLLTMVKNCDLKIVDQLSGVSSDFNRDFNNGHLIT